MERQLHEQAEYLASLRPGEHPEPARLGAIWKDDGVVVGDRGRRTVAAKDYDGMMRCLNRAYVRREESKGAPP
jgi:hypothetical protein